MDQFRMAVVIMSAIDSAEAQEGTHRDRHETVAGGFERHAGFERPLATLGKSIADRVHVTRLRWGSRPKTSLEPAAPKR